MIYFQSQVDRLMAEKEATIERLEKQVELERKRAESAIDQVLALSGAVGVTPAKPREDRGPDMDSTRKFLASIGEDVEGEPT